VARTQTTGRWGGGRGVWDNGVHRPGGSSDGQRQRVWGPAAPVWKREERISSNLGMAKLGGRSTERGKTVVALGKIRREREASGGRRQRSGHGNGGEGGGAREGGGGGGEELVTGERKRGSVTFEWLGRWCGREGKRRGVRPWGCHAARGRRGAWP
jgi:hypothetical protein